MDLLNDSHDAPPSGGTGGVSLETTWVLIEPIDKRLTAMEKRLMRMEKSINVLLSLFNMPIPDDAGAPAAEKQSLASFNNNPNQEHGLELAEEEEPMFSLFDMPNSEDEGAPMIEQAAPAPNAFVPHQATVTDTKDGKYTYQSLDARKSQVRILTLDRSKNFDDPIIGNLKVISLDDDALAYSTNSYTALSYTWGAPIFDGSIRLNGYAFPVTKNLEQALRFMRNSKPRYPGMPQMGNMTNWWIDQICINQEDIDERGEQVDLMRRIYKRASEVSVWLGEEADDSTVAIDVLKALSIQPAITPGEKAFEYPRFTDNEVHRHWTALDALFKRPWWERVWIRQEIALSHTVTLFCGDASCSIDLLEPALTALRYAQLLGFEAPVSHILHGPSSDDGSIAVPWDFHPHALGRLRQSTTGGYSWVSLESMLPVAKSCKATDPRDTVFSVLGLCDPETYNVHANYRNDLPAVLTAAARAVMGQEYDLDILGACQNPGRKHNLPSWVPNLSEPWRAMPFATCDSQNSRKLILRITDYDTSDVTVEGECLVVRGGLVDTIAIICDDVVKNDASHSDLDAVYEAWQRFVNLTGQSNSLHPTEKYDYAKDEKDQEEGYSCTEVEHTANWIRFVSIIDDEASDLRNQNTSSKRKKKKNKNKHIVNCEPSSDNQSDVLLAAENELGPYHQLNLRLCRSYLVPSSHSYKLHPNRRIHDGLRVNGPGRRLCISKAGYIALAPAEVKIGDTIAIFQGATFPYILRKFGGRKKHVLVGECFVPSFVAANGEALARDEFNKSLEAVIRLY